MHVGLECVLTHVAGDIGGYGSRDVSDAMVAQNILIQLGEVGVRDVTHLKEAYAKLLSHSYSNNMKDHDTSDPVSEGAYLNPVMTWTHLVKLISGALPVHEIRGMGGYSSGGKVPPSISNWKRVSDASDGWLTVDTRSKNANEAFQFVLHYLLKIVNWALSQGAEEIKALTSLLDAMESLLTASRPWNTLDWSDGEQAKLMEPDIGDNKVFKDHNPSMAGGTWPVMAAVAMSLVGAGAFSIKPETTLTRGIQYGPCFVQKSWPAGLDVKVESVTYTHVTRLHALIKAIRFRLKYGFESVELEHLGATRGHKPDVVVKPPPGKGKQEVKKPAEGKQEVKKPAVIALPAALKKEKRLTRQEKKAAIIAEVIEDAKDAFRAAHIPMTSKDYIEILGNKNQFTDVRAKKLKYGESTISGAKLAPRITAVLDDLVLHAVLQDETSFSDVKQRSQPAVVYLKELPHINKEVKAAIDAYRGDEGDLAINGVVQGYDSKILDVGAIHMGVSRPRHTPQAILVGVTTAQDDIKASQQNDWYTLGLFPKVGHVVGVVMPSTVIGLPRLIAMYVEEDTSGNGRFLIRTGPLEGQTGKTGRQSGVEIGGDMVCIPAGEELGYNAQYLQALLDTGFLTKPKISTAELDKGSKTMTLPTSDPESWLVYIRGKPQPWNPITYRKPTDEEVAQFRILQEAQKPKLVKTRKSVPPKQPSVESKSAKDSAGSKGAEPPLRKDPKKPASGAPTGAGLIAGDKCEVLYEGRWYLAKLTDVTKTRWKVICECDQVVRHACLQMLTQ